MNLLNKLKLVTGIKSDKKRDEIDNTQYLISQDDTIDIVFAKNLIKNDGNFFYCDKKTNLIKTAQALTSKLKIESIYCIEPIIQELLTKASINYNDKHYMQCDGIISSCEFLIAQHGKIMLSSKQLGSNNIKNLPKEHIIIAYTSQIVKSLNEGMSGLNKRYIDNLPSTITTIKSQQIQENENTEGNIKNLSVLLIEDYQIPKSK